MVICQVFLLLMHLNCSFCHIMKIKGKGAFVWYLSFYSTTNQSGVGSFRQKNNFAEDELDGTNVYSISDGIPAVLQKQKTLRILFWTLPRKRKQLGIPSPATKIEANSWKSVLNHIASFGIGSSPELGMPRNEHFLSRNNGNRAESIPWNFFGMKFRSQP